MKMQGRAITEDPEGAARQMLSSLPEADQDVLSDPQVVGALLPSMKEAYRSGADGPAWEGALMVRPWGFRLQDISIKVYIWHGEADVMNPLQFGELCEIKFPTQRRHFYQTKATSSSSSVGDKSWSSWWSESKKDNSFSTLNANLI